MSALAFALFAYALIASGIAALLLLAILLLLATEDEDTQQADVEAVKRFVKRGPCQHDD